MRHPPVIQQIQMRQQCLRGSIFRQREPPDSARSTDKWRHPLEIQIVQRRIHARSRVKRSPTDQRLDFQVLHQRGVEPDLQFFRGVEPLADQPSSDLSDQRLHLGMPHRVVRSLQEDEAMRANGGGAVEFPFRRRDPFFILDSVVITEQSYIDVAPFHFV